MTVMLGSTGATIDTGGEVDWSGEESRVTLAHRAVCIGLGTELDVRIGEPAELARHGKNSTLRRTAGGQALSDMES
jgi:hypothetical protein